MLKFLKNNKYRDPFGLCNELFKENVAGDDLKIAILKLFNRIKSEQIFPEILQICDITPIYKLKGNKNDFDSYRGIFRVPIIRTILDRLIYYDQYEVIDQALSDSNVGARKKRNVRDNIFVLNAVTNSVINGESDPKDVQVFDIEKCFDALWVQECINDMFETGFDNDKLPLLFIENQNAKVAIKSPTGISNRVFIRNIIMQGTVWGSLFCTASMENLGKHVYEHTELAYKYKKKVIIPSLGMVDDILTVTKCSGDTVKMNAVVNAFIESKKLKLNKNKCHKIHVQKNAKQIEACQKLKVHDDEMEDSRREKYLGDIVDRTGSVKNTIEDRKNKGHGTVSEILAIINEIPLGQFKIEIGLKLREAMLINGMLFNSEAWHGISDVEIQMLERVDELLLCSLVGGHAKTPVEFLYLETGSLPIRYIISCRRMTYLHTILTRSDEELTKRVYIAQRESPTKGDFFNLVTEDFKKICKILDEEKIVSKSKEAHKRNIKTTIMIAAFQDLKERQSKHSKVKDIHYDKLETQQYMKSQLFTNEEVNLLFAIRSRMIDSKSNFKSKYIKDDLTCRICHKAEENQFHLLHCKVLNDVLKSNDIISEQVKYEDIYSEHKKQKLVTSIFAKLLNIRKQMLENRENTTYPSNLRWIAEE